MSSFGDQIASYYVPEYIKLFGLVDSSYFGPKSHAGAFNRMFNIFRPLNTTYMITQTGVTCTALRLHMGNAESIYGYLYSRTCKGATEIEFYTLGGSYLSQDGEYRKCIVPIIQITKTLAAYSPIITIIENMIINAIESKEVVLSSENYPANAIIDIGRLPIYVLAFSWFRDYIDGWVHPRDRFPLDKHLHDTWLQLVGEFPGARTTYKELHELIGKKASEIRQSMFSTEIRGSNRLYAGQKIIPLTIVEALRQGDIKHATWLELYINGLVADLLVNQITPTFAFNVTWFFICGANERLFDNPQMKEKYAQSKLAEDVAEDLHHVEVRTSHIENATSLNDTRHDTSSPATGFKTLSNNILKDIFYVDSELRLSDYALCIISEHTNTTAGNLHVYFKLVKDFEKQLPRICFEWLYGIYCLHARLTVIHGDLHVNNATINLAFTVRQTTLAVAYKLGSNIYKFETTGHTGTIIDFSRSILGDKARITADFSAAYATEFFRSISPLLEFMRKHFPQQVNNNEDRLIRLLERHFPVAFKLAATLDVYSLFSGIAIMIDIDPEYGEEGFARMPEDVKNLIADIAEAAEEIFLRDFDALMNGDAAANTAYMSAPWGAEEIITAHFVKYITPWPPSKDIVVTDMFNAENPITYLHDEPAHWNPVMNPDYYNKIAAAMDMKQSTLSRYEMAAECRNPAAEAAIITDTEKTKHVHYPYASTSLVNKVL